LTVILHSVRPHLISGQTTYGLDNDALVARNETNAVHIPYADITTVRLIDYPNFGGRQKQCTLTTRAQGKLAIRSHHYVSLGNFEDRSAAFDPFFRELCSRVHAANPRAEFLWGSNALRIVWGIVLACAAFGWLGWTVAAIENPSAISNTIGGAVVLSIASLVGLRAFTKIKVARFDPRDPPLN